MRIYNQPPRPLLESLEQRELLSGVTLITHGLGTGTAGWVSAMAAAIAQRADLQAVANFSTYKITLTDPGHDGGPLSVSLSKISGTNPLTATKSPEILLLLDWSDVAGPSYSRSSKDIGAAVAARLADPTFFPDLPGPLAQLPLSFIGHSRGASVVSQIAGQLGRRGIWVDQMTTLDPVPIALYGDPVALAGANIIFYDNYFQWSDSLAVGNKIPGALNVGPLNLPAGYVNSLGNGYHDNTHLYYQGTINQATNAGDGAHTVPSKWYTAATRTGAGFYWSRLVGGKRPAAGLSAGFGGAAGRTAIVQDITSWANIGLITFTTPASTFGLGSSVTAKFRYQDQKNATTVTWLLDPDRNPYNGNEIAITTQSLPKTTRITPGTITLTIPADLPVGAYHLLGRITDGVTTRMEYANNALNVSAGTPRLYTLAPAAPTQAPVAGTVSLVGAPGTAPRSGLGKIIANLGRYTGLLGKIGLSNIPNLGSITSLIPSISSGNLGKWLNWGKFDLGSWL